MDMIKCPVCGEMYSSTYRKCPFCEEDGDDGRKIRYTPKRRIADRQKTQSARGGLIVVLALVLGLLSWYLFGDKILPRADAPAEPDAPASQTEPSVPASNPGGADPFYEEPTKPSEPAEPSGPSGPAGQPEPAEPPVDENVDVSNAKLNRADFTLGYAGEKFTLRVSGTEAAPHWSIDNANVATLTGDGTVTAVANGSTTIRCKVGTRELTCIVRVTNTGRKAEPADAPTSAESVTPTKPETPANTPPATPTTPTTPTTPSTPSSGSTHVDASSLWVETNQNYKLPKEPGELAKGKILYDCTLHIGGDPTTLVVKGTDAPVSSWTSSNTSVVEVSSDGKLTLKGKGTSYVTAAVGDATVKCIIRVN